MAIQMLGQTPTIPKANALKNSGVDTFGALSTGVFPFPSEEPPKFLECYLKVDYKGGLVW